MVLILLLLILIFSSFFTLTNIALSVSDKNSDNNKNTNENIDKFKLAIEIALNNVRPENPQIIKLVAFINGEIQTKTIDIKNDLKSFKISIKTPH